MRIFPPATGTYYYYYYYYHHRLPLLLTPCPLAPPRPPGNEKKAVKDTQLGPYFIPSGTTAFISLTGLAHNPDIW